MFGWLDFDAEARRYEAAKNERQVSGQLLPLHQDALFEGDFDLAHECEQYMTACRHVRFLSRPSESTSVDSLLEETRVWAREKSLVTGVEDKEKEEKGEDEEFGGRVVRCSCLRKVQLKWNRIKAAVKTIFKWFNFGPSN